MANRKILFVTQEITPYLPSNEIADLGRSLPQSLQGKGYEVRTFMPKFGAINERRNQLHEVIRLSGLNIEINDNDHPLILKVASMQPVRIQVYFIDNDDYFQKSKDDADAFGSNRPDNDERAIYFARGTMETVKKLRWEPDIIQCSGWMTALTPLYMRPSDDAQPFGNAKTVYCVTPDGPLMAPIDPEMFKKLLDDGMPEDIINEVKGAETADSLVTTNVLHKIAILRSHGVVFLTDTPDPELLDFVEKKEIPYITKDEAMKGREAFTQFYDKLLNS